MNAAAFYLSSPTASSTFFSYATLPQNLGQVAQLLQGVANSRISEARQYLHIDYRSHTLSASPKTRGAASMPEIAQAISHLMQVHAQNSIAYSASEVIKKFEMVKERFIALLTSLNRPLLSRRPELLTVEKASQNVFESLKSELSQAKISPTDRSDKLQRIAECIGSQLIQLSHNVRAIENWQRPHILQVMHNKYVLMQASSTTKSLAQKSTSEEWDDVPEIVREEDSSAEIHYICKSVKSVDARVVRKVDINWEGNPSGIMEELVCSLAEIFEFSHLFAPTRTVEVTLKKKETSLNTWIWKLASGSCASQNPTRRFSIQSKLEGQDLLTYLQYIENKNKETELPAPILQQDLIDPTLAVLVLGMLDAHSGNIWVKPKGEIAFFDNTYCLSHSNQAQSLATNHLRSSLVNDLLLLDECYKLLSPDQLQEIRAKLEFCRNRLSHLEESMQKAAKRLPPGWLHPDKAMEAMQERLDGMCTALDANLVQSLADLNYAAIPSIKFLYAIKLIQTAIPDFAPSCDDPGFDFYCRTSCQEVNNAYIPKILKDAVRENLNLDAIYKICQDNVHHQDLIKSLIELFNKGHHKNKKNKNKDERLCALQEYTAFYLRGACFDSKTISKDSISLCAFQSVCDQLIMTSGVKVKACSNTPKTISCPLICINEENMSIHYWTQAPEGEWKLIPIDYTSKMGIIKIFNKELLNLDDLQTGLPAYFHFNATEDEVNDLIQRYGQHEGAWLVYRDPARRSTCQLIQRIGREICKMDVAFNQDLKNFIPINLETAIGSSQKVQDFESESLGMGAEHSQKVKAAPNTSDYGSKDCALWPTPIAVSRFKNADHFQQNQTLAVSRASLPNQQALAISRVSWPNFQYCKMLAEMVSYIVKRYLS